MDEQIIRTLQEQAIEERQYIQEKYGQDEDVVQVVNRRDYLTGRQSAAVRLYDNERNVPLHRHGYIELMYAYKGTFTHRFGEEKVLLEEGDLLVMNQYVEHCVVESGEENIGINIIAVPEFFEKPFQMLKKQNKIMDFFGGDAQAEYQKAAVSDLSYQGSACPGKPHGKSDRIHYGRQRSQRGDQPVYYGAALFISGGTDGPGGA